MKATPVPEFSMFPKTMVTMFTAGAQVVGNAGSIAVVNGAFAVPGAKYGFGSQFQLFVGVLGKSKPLCSLITAL